MSPPPTTAPTPDGGDAAAPTPITAAIHRDIIQTHILNRLDGPTLASTSCASSQLLALCGDDHLWRDICNATWPSTTHPLVSSAIASFPSGHRSFYSDSFPATRPTTSDNRQARVVSSSDSYDYSSTQELISAVDIFYDDELIYSKVLVTETHSSWFLGTPFRVELLDRKEVVSEPLKFNFNDNDHLQNLCSDDNTSDHKRLRLSWILIDPSTKRAVNVASREALEVSRHWLSTNELQFRYATEMGSSASGGGPVLCSVVVACGGGDDTHVHVREVSLQLEDMDGKIVPGRDGLVVLNEAMEGQRCKITDGEMERRSYEMFLKMRSKYREMKMRRERSLDMVCVAMEVLVFLALCVLFLRRNS